MPGKTHSEMNIIGVYFLGMYRLDKMTPFTYLPDAKVYIAIRD
jgi:hypothetical protein